MARRINKPALKPHIVVIDTNIIYFDNKSEVVNPEFESFWVKNSDSFPMELKIPFVVAGEILYQQTAAAKKLLIDANLKIEQLSSITEKKYKHRIDESRIKKEIENRFQNWVNSKNAEIVPTPVEEIDWGDVVSRSIWRKIPFTRDEKNPKNEKGFRDMMILETLANICKNELNEKNIVFICGDKALKKSAEIKLNEIDKFSAYESLKDFESFIELTQRDLTEEFVRKILFRAREKFFERDDRNCLIYKYDLMKNIREKHKVVLSPHEEKRKPSGFFPIIPPEIKPLEEESAYVQNPQFDRVEDKTIYHWKSVIIFQRKFEQRFNSGLILTEGSDNCAKKLLDVRVTVKWKAHVTKDGRFYDCEIIDFNEIEHKFEEMGEG